MKIDRHLLGSKHFRLQQLGEGVYAAIHISGGEAIANAGIVDLGDRTLIYDTFFTPKAATDLRAAAEKLTGRPVDLVINSHCHNDHTWGNQVFSPNAKILSTVETRRLILAAKGEDDFARYWQKAEADLEAAKRSFKASQDAGERRQLAAWIDYGQSLVDARFVLQVTPPDTTFTGRLVIQGAARSAELISFEGGHSRSDAILLLQQERIAFLGDLLFVDAHPWLSSGDPDTLAAILQKVAEFNPQVCVPGHGSVGGMDNLLLMRQYLSILNGLAAQMVDEKGAEVRIDKIAIPEPFTGWLFEAFFPTNLHFIYKRRLQGQANRLD